MIQSMDVSDEIYQTNNWNIPSSIDTQSGSRLRNPSNNSLVIAQELFANNGKKPKPARAAILATDVLGKTRPLL